MKNTIYGIILFLFVLFSPGKQLYAQTTLNAGDIAILLVQTRGADNFAFVTFVDMDPGTVIYFTDCGADAAGFNTPCSEGAFSYTVPAGGLTAGDIIQFTDNPSIFVPYTDSRITGTAFLLSTIGDQVIAFQDASNPGGSANAGNNPRFIFVNNVESTIFAGDKTDSNETGLPSGLTNTGASRTALGLGAGPGPGDEFDIAIYNGTYDFSSGGIAAAKLAFSDLSNYYQTNTEADATYTSAFNAIPAALTLTASCAATDNTPSVPDVSPLPNVTAQCEVTSLTPPTATDNCGGTVTVTNNATLPITTQGTTVVTWTYDDGNGNTSNQNQNIIIDDTTPPTPDVASLPNVTAQCEVTSLTSPTATDNCGGTVTVTNNATLPITAQGTTVVTWTYDDGNGNTSNQNQNIVVDDTTPPTPDAASLPDVTAECEVTSLTTPTATDNCGGSLTITNNATLPITSTTVVTWAYDDGNGNIAFQNQNVIIDDTTAPVPDAASLPDVIAECEVTTLTPPTATDNCGGTITVTNNATLPITSQGTTVVIWTFDDGNGNTITQNQNVIIDDVTDPVAVCSNLEIILDSAGNATITAAQIDGGSTDNCGIAAVAIDIDTFTCANIGANTVTLTVTDTSGRSSSCEAIVNVSSEGMAVASNEGPICDGEEVQLSETSSIATSWLWSSDGLATFDDATSQNPIASNASNGEIFTVEITFSGGCTTTATTAVTVNETEAPAGESSQEFCLDDNATLADIAADVNEEVIWYADANRNTILPLETRLVNGNTYFATQFNETTGCESLEQLAVTVSLINCTDVSTFSKRAFSPNGDGVNDTFTITELRNNYPNYSMEIYNRYGSLLYKGNASTPDWDGTSSEGTALSDGILANGVYFFIINFGDGETKPFQGIVYLNR